MGKKVKGKGVASSLDETLAGAAARAGSQSTIHPLDTVKVRMQATDSVFETTRHNAGAARRLKVQAKNVLGLYRGVFGAASGAGIAIGAYFALYSWTKKLVHRVDPKIKPGPVAFIAGAVAAGGSTVVKVPIAVCIRSVQAGVFPHAFSAATNIVRRAGPRGLLTGFWPTLFEDVPDMAVKFAVYESLKSFHSRTFKRKANIQEDLLIGGIAGATSAAATTPWDVVKTRMMCSASLKPTVRGAIKGVLAEGNAARGFFKGVGPRTLSSGIHSAIFFCFYEAIRSALVQRAYRKQMDSFGLDTFEKRASETQNKSSRQANKHAGVTACLSLALIDSHR